MTGPDAPQTETAIVLPAVLEIADARGLLDQLLLVPEDAGIIIDAHAVLDIATPCLQVLLAAGQRLAAHGQALTLKAPSDAFVAAMEDLGLFSALMSWNVVE